MSKNNWTKTVATINREKYTIPEGWDTRDKVALDLQCAPDRVADLLKPGIQSGQIERQDFPVWDDARRLTVRVTCYRVAGPEKVPAAPTSVVPGDRETARIERALRTDPSKTDYLIAKNVRSTVGVVRQVRASLGL
jgi:hypothetical protein